MAPRPAIVPQRGQTAPMAEASGTPGARPSSPAMGRAPRPFPALPAMPLP